MTEKSNIKTGDVFQILTSKGVSYAQVINTHPKWKYVIAVFEISSINLTEKITEVICGAPQFITTFLLQEAVEQRLFTILLNEPVADHLSDFPIFRGTNNLDGERTIWFFWDGHNEWRVERPLTDEEKMFPEGPSLPSAPMLVEMIERNYRAERAFV